MGKGGAGRPVLRVTLITTALVSLWFLLPNLVRLAVAQRSVLSKRRAVSVVGNPRLYFIGKRVFDTVVAAILLVLLAPVMLVISLLIRLDSSGPAIFAQERIGAYVKYKGGQRYWELRPFVVYKFRTMRQNNDSRVHQLFVKALIEGDEATINALQNGASGGMKYKLNNDPRTTRVGKLLRKSSLDELPQLWNVLKGEMSLVGPRPPLAYEVELYSPAHMRRLEAQPGLTGLWQVSARSEVDFERMVALDVEYVDNQSFWLDFTILLKTPMAVLTTKGAA